MNVTYRNKIIISDCMNYFRETSLSHNEHFFHDNLYIKQYKPNRVIIVGNYFAHPFPLILLVQVEQPFI